LAGERADHVVRFVAGIFENGQAHGFAIAADVGELHGEIFGHRRALGFVGGEELVAEGGGGEVERNTKIVRLPVFDKLADHVGKEVGNVGGNAGSAAETHGHGGVEGAEDVAHGVDEEEALWRRCGHWTGTPTGGVQAGEYIRPGPGACGGKGREGAVLTVRTRRQTAHLTPYRGAAYRYT